MKKNRSYNQIRSLATIILSTIILPSLSLLNGLLCLAGVVPSSLAFFSGDFFDASLSTFEAWVFFVGGLALEACAVEAWETKRRIRVIIVQKQKTA